MKKIGYRIEASQVHKSQRPKNEKGRRMDNLMERWGQGLALSANLDHIKTSTMSNKRIEHSCSRLFFKQYPYTNGGFVISDILHFFYVFSEINALSSLFL